MPFTATSSPSKIISTFKQAFNQVKEILASKPNKAKTLIWTVTNTVPEYCYAHIISLLKTANLENPKLLGKLIVLPKLSTAKSSAIIAQEAQEMADVEVRYLSAEQRQVKRLGF